MQSDKTKTKQNGKTIIPKLCVVPKISSHQRYENEMKTEVRAAVNIQSHQYIRMSAETKLGASSKQGTIFTLCI